MIPISGACHFSNAVTRSRTTTPARASPSALRDRFVGMGNTVLATAGRRTVSLGATAYAEPRHQSGPSPRRGCCRHPQVPQNSPGPSASHARQVLGDLGNGPGSSVTWAPRPAGCRADRGRELRRWGCRGRSPGRSRACDDVDGVRAEADVAETGRVGACRDPVQQRVDVAEWLSAVGLEILVHQRGQARPRSERPARCLRRRRPARRTDADSRERIGDGGDVGRQPAHRRVAVVRTPALPRGPRKERRHPAAGALGQRRIDPRLFGEPLVLRRRWTGWCRRPTSSRAATRPRRGRCRPGPAGRTSRGRPCTPVHRCRRWRRTPTCHALCAFQRGLHGCEVGGGDQRVASPADRQAPHRAGELAVRLTSNSCPIFS